MKRNKHSLSYSVLLSCDMGELIPIGCVEVLPGDSIRMNSSALVRAAPLVAPVMHAVHVRIHHWFVPWRIIWSGFESFITGGADGNDATPFPVMSTNAGVNVGELLDYFGVPTGVPNLTISALQARAYANIFNEWYRDQDLQTLIPLTDGNGSDTQTSRALQNCQWEKDYFTSCRPWEQKGPTVTIPIGQTAPVKTSATPIITGAQSNIFMTTAGGGAVGAAGDVMVQAGGAFGKKTTASGTFEQGLYINNMYADLAATAGVSVNQLRQALALQRFEENRARYGSRFPEYLRSLGITSSDARLQRPEYLSGGKQVIQFSEIVQTANDASPGTGKVGDLKGHGITAMRTNRFTRFFEEHGYIITLMSCRPKTVYMNSLHRQWNRRIKTDVWQRELEHIGQQQVLNKEIYAAHAQPDGVFGYQDRYDEYRRIESRVAGEFRTLFDFWHMARNFASPPALNSSFVSCVPTKRNFAVQTSDCLQVQVRHSIKARRILSKTGSSFTF